MKPITVEPLSALVGAGLLALVLTTVSARQSEPGHTQEASSPHAHAVLWWLVDHLVQDQLDLRSQVWKIKERQCASRADEQAVLDDQVRAIYQAKLWEHEFPARTQEDSRCKCKYCAVLQLPPNYTLLNAFASLSELDLSNPTVRSMLAAADQRMFDTELFAPVRDEARGFVRDELLGDAE